MTTQPGPQFRDPLATAETGPLTDRFARTAPAIRAALRIGAGLLFAQHGAQKLLGWFGGFGPDGGTAPLVSLMGLAGVLELFGGLLLAIGLLTRPVAAIVFVEMVLAYFMAHLPQGLVPIQNGGELALIYALTWLYFAAAGPGAASVDGILRTRRAAPPA